MTQLHENGCRGNATELSGDGRNTHRRTNLASPKVNSPRLRAAEERNDCPARNKILDSSTLCPPSRGPSRGGNNGPRGLSQHRRLKAPKFARNVSRLSLTTRLVQECGQVPSGFPRTIGCCERRCFAGMLELGTGSPPDQELDLGRGFDCQVQSRLLRCVSTC